MLAIAVLSLPAIAIVAAVPIAARERAQCYEQRHARCAPKYACEHRNAGQDYFTNFMNADLSAERFVDTR